MSVIDLFKRRSSACDHASSIAVCVWGLDCNDTGGSEWDGAYTDFCPKCKKFSAEMRWGSLDAAGKPRYPSDRYFIRLKDGREWSVAKDRSDWLPVDEFRERVNELLANREPVFRGW